MDGRSIPYARGYVLGGSTCISEVSFIQINWSVVVYCVWVDSLVFTRGSKDDYDRWARVTDDEGWSWDSLFPYMLKVKLFFTFSSHLPIYKMPLLDGKTYSTPQPSRYNRRI